MKRVQIYCLLFVGLIWACEDVYVPEIDDVGSVIVADARIVFGANNNYIALTQSNGFNDNFNEYPAVANCKVHVIDNLGQEFELTEHETGKFYVNFELNPDKQYKVLIEQGENIFESDFEQVPPEPTLDTVYGIAETIDVISGGESDADNIREAKGVQLYADMISSPELPNYRFTAKKVLEFFWEEERGQLVFTHYYWSTSVPSGIFNIAAPPEYSNSNEIKKHPLFFLPESVELLPDSIMIGWILVLYQHGISEPSYNYYNDLNNQLDSEGRIFDPVYVQARNNLKCINNPEEIILGNFEISNVTEHRYFVRYISEKDGYKVKRISNRSPIPWSGETIDSPPDFWVH